MLRCCWPHKLLFQRQQGDQWQQIHQWQFGTWILRSMIGVCVSALGLTGVGTRAWADSLELKGQVAARVTQGEGTPSWRDGGFGRLDLSSDPASIDSAELYALGRADLTLDWRPSTLVSAYLHGTARAEPDELAGPGDVGEPAGVVEAFLELEPTLASADRLRFRFGHFLMPTSRENIDVAWASPYTLTFSALNSWIGEEVRLTGVEASYQWAVGDVDNLSWTVATFGGNDTAGTLLAWRGWAMGDRLTVFNETLPLPPLPGLEPGGGFEPQQDAGTQPFGSDLDGRLGWASTLTYRFGETGALRLSGYDNQGDRELHDGQYAWDTRFYTVGVDRSLTNGSGTWDWVAEWMWGRTGMGKLDQAHVDADFEAGFLLASFSRESFRTTLRWDTFETVDRDGSVADDPNGGDGSAWTLALFFQPVESPWRWALEIVDLDARRDAAAISPVGNGSPDVDGRTLSLELRYLF